MRTKLLAMVGMIAVFAVTGIAKANLLSNGNFEIVTTNGTAADWVTWAWGNGWSNTETNDWANGTLVQACGAAGGGGGGVYQNIPVTEGLTYRLTVDSGADDWWLPTGTMSLIWLDAAGVTISDDIRTTVDPAVYGENYDIPHPFETYILDAVAPLGAVTAKVEFAANNATGSVGFDNAMLIVYDPVADTDGDGLPDSWENTYGLDPYDDGTTNINNGASGDPDSDSLNNFGEYTNGTNPKDSDTDDDDLSDGDEVLLYSTDPLNADTDGDFLNDGDEVDVHSTDPLLADTDFDNVNDATEIYSGSDPFSAGSVPANDRPDVVGIEHFDYTNGVFVGVAGGELFDYDNNVSNDTYTGHTGASSDWNILWGGATVTGGKLLTQQSGVYRALNGDVTGGEEIALFAASSLSPEVDSDVLYAKVDMVIEPGTLWGGLSLYANGMEEIYFGMSDQGFGPEFAINEHVIDSTAYSSVPMSNGVSYTMVVKIDGITKTANLWVDPDLGINESIPDVSLAISDGHLRCDSIRLAAGEADGGILWDNLVVGSTWASLSSIGTDTDGDGLRDTWEDAYGLDPNDNTGDNGASGDPDEDTLTNAQELDLGTSPSSDDTDGDGLTDDSEINTHLTDPLDTDSDNDGLSDGDEVNIYGTEPLDADTDGDDEDDGVEISQGTDPLDPESNSAALGLIILDGVLDVVGYGDAVSTQTVNTSWADNTGELNAAYATMKAGKLYLFLSGNIDTAWNKLQIFIDSTDAVTTNVLQTAGNSGTDVLDGLVFDTGFSPEYHLNIRRGTWSGGAAFNLDVANLATMNSVTYDAVLGAGILEGSAYSGTNALVNASPIGVAYDDSNTTGVVPGNDAANPADALAAVHGLELCIALSDLGNPSGSIRISAMICAEPNMPISNQILGGFAPPQGSLDGVTNVNFNLYAGEQFFTVDLPSASMVPMITSAQLASGNTLFELNVIRLSLNTDYRIQETDSLAAGFADIPGTDWTAGATNAVITVPVDTDANPEMFFRVVSP